jgi:hypothetical protein
MVMFRRLDPLANAGPYQRLLKSPVKSFTLTEAQYDRLKERRPDLIVTEGEAAVIAHPYRDFLEIHYAFPEVEAFRDRFADLFTRAVGASSKAEAPRGVVLSFRDRPNRSLADTVFWSTALDEGPQWVEMNWVAVPEQPEPEDTVGDGFRVREAPGGTDADGDAVAAIDAAVAGQPELTRSGLTSIYENARWLRIIDDSSGRPVAFLNLRSEPGGWGIIEQIAVRPELAGQLRDPLLHWTVAFLRNNGGRRLRRKVHLDQAADLSLMRGMGFTAAETGLDYTRPVDADEIKSKIEERQAHGTLIKFGDWR